MLNKLKGLKRLVPRVSWKSESQETTELKQLSEDAISMLVEMKNVVNGQNTAIGLLYQDIEGLKSEAITLLSAIAIQHGGELVVKPEFFELLSNPVNNNLRLLIKKQEDASVLLKLEPSEEESENSEQEEKGEED